MNKTLTFSGLALAATAAAAQAPAAPTVELYGILDGGLSYTSGLKSGSPTRLVSGIMDGSRLGVRGNEDIGGGWRALFTLENRLELNNGTIANRPPSGTQVPDRLASASLLGLPAALQPAVVAVDGVLAQTIGVNTANAFWDRQAYVGLVTPVGGLLAGRQYTPAYEAFATFDATHTAGSLSAGQVSAVPAGVDIRVNNALQYRFQLGPWSGGAMVTFDGLSGGANRLMGVSGFYKTEALSIGGGYNTRKNEVGATSLKSGLFGVLANVGPGQASAMVASIQDDHPSGLSTIAATLVAATAASPTPLTLGQGTLVQNAFAQALRQDARLYNVGYTLKVGALTSTVAYSRFDDRTGTNADVDSYGILSTYALSRRTDTIVGITRFNNKGLAQAAPGQAGFLGGFTATAGTDSTNIVLGMRHRF
jgi:predicted porin